MPKKKKVARQFTALKVPKDDDLVVISFKANAETVVALNQLQIELIASLTGTGALIVSGGGRSHVIRRAIIEAAVHKIDKEE